MRHRSPFAHNYDFAQGKIPGRFRRGTEPTARRNVTSSVQTKYESGTEEADVFIRWDEKFRNNEPVSARIVTYQWLGNGKQLAIIYEMIVLRDHGSCPCCGNGSGKYSGYDCIESRAT